MTVRVSRLTLVLASAAALAVPITVAGTAAGAGAVTATFRQQSTWPQGYTATYTIANDTGAAVTGWIVEFDLPAGTTVSSSWEAAMTRTGNHYRFANLSHNATVPNGGSRSFGFVAGGTGVPTGCLLNGGPCGGGPTPPPPNPPPPPPNPPPPRP
ncbi:MAG TPA: cellulose binding domain-containing protein, partial [Micromonosporaceae bacterium]|nr:cellulose binding domain-containing protein [Micromonosporaceae bacterium]